MDMTAKRWATIAIAVALILGFLSLGFDAMSTSPLFIVPNWVSIAFFVAAGMVAIGTI